MEIIYILIIVLFIGIIISLLWKNRCLKHDIYDFTEKLENSLNELLNSRNLNKTICVICVPSPQLPHLHHFFHPPFFVINK